MDPEQPIEKPAEELAEEDTADISEDGEEEE